MSRRDRGYSPAVLWTSKGIRGVVLAIVSAFLLATAGGAASALGTAPPPVKDPVEAAPLAVPHLDGIDVSHWQNTIDWAAVAAAGKRFAFIKATEKQTYNDPMYETNRAGAKAAGMRVGAYHFARPDATTNDAVIEADHFADVAAPRSGEIYPTLDLEVSGGLATRTLIEWVWDFLDEFRARTGLTVIIYTTPTFWRNSMGDTTEFATGGYPRLWIANWDVGWPDVPADDWGGYGAAFWQYSDCGTVPGVQGCVDTDHYRGTNLRRVLIP